MPAIKQHQSTTDVLARHVARWVVEPLRLGGATTDVIIYVISIQQHRPMYKYSRFATCQSRSSIRRGRANDRHQKSEQQDGGQLATSNNALYDVLSLIYHQQQIRMRESHFYTVINVKKLQFIHTVNGDGSKTAKINKKSNVNHTNIA